jgi:hypothetical protein
VPADVSSFGSASKNLIPLQFMIDDSLIDSFATNQSRTIVQQRSKEQKYGAMEQ